MLWIDITGTTEEDGVFLEQTFNFHGLVVEDCISDRIHSPKIDDFEEYIFIIVHSINHSADSDMVETGELNIFLGHNFVVSNHNIPALQC
ncbi:CorA family divalent cation transporter [Chloroflexota bacterium]